MVLTVLCFMLSPPWCMGSRLDNSTLTPIPGKVKSRSYIIESFRNAETRCRHPLSGRLRAGSRLESRKDDWTRRGLVGTPLLLNMASTTIFIVALAPRGCQTMKCRASARLPRRAAPPAKRQALRIDRVGETRHPSKHPFSRASRLPSKNVIILSLP